jgi:lysophospholipase L1-like esterase
MLTQLKRAEGKHYNLTIISSGGNDTWKMTPLASVEQNLREVISRTMTLSGKNIVLIIYNNDISAPVFPFFIRWLITRRTRIINEIYLRTAEIYGIQAVPVFLPGETCPSNFFSHDGLHPSSEGYRIMYIRLWAALYQHRFDYNLREY